MHGQDSSNKVSLRISRLERMPFSLGFAHPRPPTCRYPFQILMGDHMNWQRHFGFQVSILKGLARPSAAAGIRRPSARVFAALHSQFLPPVAKSVVKPCFSVSLSFVLRYSINVVARRPFLGIKLNIVKLFVDEGVVTVAPIQTSKQKGVHQASQTLSPTPSGSSAT